MHEGARSGGARQDGATSGADTDGGWSRGAGAGPQGGADAGRRGGRRRSRAGGPRRRGGRGAYRGGRRGLRCDRLRRRSRTGERGRPQGDDGLRGRRQPRSGSEAMQPYLFAKARADERLQESDLDYTIIRPGSLTEEEGAGRIEAAEVLGRRGEIPRDDVARTFAEALEMPNTYRKTFEIIGGETPIREALERI